MPDLIPGRDSVRTGSGARPACDGRGAVRSALRPLHKAASTRAATAFALVGGAAVALTTGVLAASPVVSGPTHAAAAGTEPGPTCWSSDARASGALPPDPYVIRLVPTARANGASGTVRLRFAPSPFGVSVTPDGHHLFDAELSASGLPRPADGALVAWAATPDLVEVQKLGSLMPEGVLTARVHFNKFLVFVTEEPSADVERWSGSILLRGVSPSGRMHTMAGHGPFSGEPCFGLTPF